LDDLPLQHKLISQQRLSALHEMQRQSGRNPLAAIVDLRHRVVAHGVILPLRDLGSTMKQG